MASTYSDLKIELIGTGEQVGQWGTTTNTNLGTAIEEAIVGSANVSFSSADVTLTLTNTNGTQAARHLRLNLTGTSGGARNLILGSGCQIDKPYIINNGLADAVTVKNTTGTGVAVPAGKTMWVYNNGTNVVEVMNASATPFDASSGGTGRSTLTANNVLLGNGTSAVNFVAPSTAKNTLTSNGTTWISESPFTTGMIMLWSGSIASIPSGWALCNGSNGTPDLRNRFIVGAGSTYAVGATGGSADSIVVSHTHTGTTNTTGEHAHAVGGSFIGSGINSNGGYVFAGSNVPTTSAGIHSHTLTIDSSGSSGTNANLPPYYALAYIMKL
jgi:hypothetical protein